MQAISYLNSIWVKKSILIICVQNYLQILNTDVCVILMQTRQQKPKKQKEENYYVIAENDLNVTVSAVSI